MAERALQTVRPNQQVAIPVINEDLELIKRTFAKGLHDDELSVLVASSKNLGLSIIGREIYGIVYNAKDESKRTLSIQVGIDGYRKVAARSGEYLGQDGPYWCGADGEWKDVWLEKVPPMAAKVGVWRKGFTHPVYAVALFSEYRNAMNSLWNSKPAVMIAKCAEGQAIRKAFADWLAGTYTTEEMAQAGGIEVEGRIVDTETGVIEERAQSGQQRQQRSQRQERPVPPRSDPRSVEQKSRDRILLSIRNLGKESISADAMDLAVAELAGVDGADLDTMPIPKLSEIFEQLKKKQRDDPDEFLAWVDSLYRDYAGADVIDVEAVEVAQEAMAVDGAVPADADKWTS